MNINWTLFPSIPINILLGDVFSIFLSLSLYLSHNRCVCSLLITSYAIIVVFVVIFFRSFFFHVWFEWNQFRLLVFDGRRVHQQIYFEIELPEITDIDKRLKNYTLFSIQFDIYSFQLNSTQFNHNNNEYYAREKKKRDGKRDWKGKYVRIYVYVVKV